MLLLKKVIMSSLGKPGVVGGLGARSAKASRFASATWYQTLGCGAPGKLAKAANAAVAPSVPAVGEQASGVKLAWMRMGTALSRSAPHCRAVSRNTFRRWLPR